MTKFGYVRVSTFDQLKNSSLENQIELIAAEGVKQENIIQEIGNATIDFRPKLEELLQKLQQGDELYVYSLDRLGRNSFKVIADLNNLRSRNIGFKSIPNKVDLSNQNDDAIVLVAAMFSQMETTVRKERTRAGIERAKLEKKYLGRKTKITENLLEKINAMREKNYPVSHMLQILDISSSTYYKAIRKPAEVK